jgi:stage IV sporulation protein FB
MLQFTLLGFPVRIHWLFWLNSALLGGALGAQTPAEMQRVAIWIAMVFLSILIHELGHALTMRKFGDRRVEIVLYAFGGLAIGSGWQERMQQILISAAGPAAQMAAGLLAWLVYRAFPLEGALLQFAFGNFIFISFFWGALNLLPIIPMDGGRISEAVLGRSKERLALTISLVTAIALAAYMGLAQGALFATLFFGMLAYNNWQGLNRRDQVSWMDVR